MEELNEVVERTIAGVKFKYNQVFHLDYEVNGNTGVVNKNKKVPTFFKAQVSRNLEACNKAYLQAIS